MVAIPKKGSSSAYVELTLLRNSNKKSLFPVKTELEIKLHNFAINSTAEHSMYRDCLCLIGLCPWKNGLSRNIFYNMA